MPTSLSNRALLVVGLVAPTLLSGCSFEASVGTKPTHVVAMPTPTPVILPTLAPGEFVSQQDPALSVRDIKEQSSRTGKVVGGVITNRGKREYNVVVIEVHAIDGQGKIVGKGRDGIQEFRPGDQRDFRTYIGGDGDNIHYEVTELRGY